MYDADSFNFNFSDILYEGTKSSGFHTKRDYTASEDKVQSILMYVDCHFAFVSPAKGKVELNQ